MIHPSHFVFPSIRWPASLLFLGSPVWFRMLLTWGFRLREEALEFGRCTYCAICKVGSSLFVRRFGWPVTGLSGHVLFRWGIATTKFPVRVHAQFATFLLFGGNANLASLLATVVFSHTGLMLSSRSHVHSGFPLSRLDVKALAFV